MFRLSVAALVSSAFSVSDETSLMQGLKPTSDKRKDSDKSHAITSLMATATTMLKNGATPDVVDFAEATLSEITTVVLPAITDAHATDQALVDSTFAMFETALKALEDGTEELKILNADVVSASAAHITCREHEEVVCRSKQECDYDLYEIWKSFYFQEEIMREYSKKVESHFCAPDANGTLQIFRDGAIELFPPWIEQKPIVETLELWYDGNISYCESNFTTLDAKTALCVAKQTYLEKAACALNAKVLEVRGDFATAWNEAILSYQAVVDEVHCLEIDRWKEWRTLSTVQCLLNRTRERNGRACDETSDEALEEVTHCEQVSHDTSVAHLLIVYYRIPELPPFCMSFLWDLGFMPGRCYPRIPEIPCTPGFVAQEYSQLWNEPKPDFFAPEVSGYSSILPEFSGGVTHTEGNSHCNQRDECVFPCAIEEPEPPICALLMENQLPSQIHFVLPQPEHECHFATQHQIATGLYDSVDVSPTGPTAFPR